MTARATTQIGLQLFTVGADLMENFEGTLARVGEAGFESVETPSLIGRPAAEWKRALSASGLRCPSLHCFAHSPDGGPGLAGDIETVIEQAGELGAAFVVMPLFLFPDDIPSPQAGEDMMAFIARATAGMGADDYKRTADFLNERGATLKDAGLRLAYHNHNREFERFDGETGLDILLAHTEPDLVCFELDIGWAHAAGANARELLDRHPSRFRLAHLKDVKPGARTNTAFQIEGASLGDGVVNWPETIAAARTAGVHYGFVELDPPFAVSAWESAAASLAHLRAA